MQVVKICFKIIAIKHIAMRILLTPSFGLTLCHISCSVSAHLKLAMISVTLIAISFHSKFLVIDENSVFKKDKVLN